MADGIDARSVSLPLFNLMFDADAVGSLSGAAQHLTRGIDTLKLTDHVEATISFEGRNEYLSVQAKDDLGKNICKELQDRFSVPSCPEGMCESVPGVLDGNCKWCGQPMFG
jgi:hypothetical protein